MTYANALVALDHPNVSDDQTQICPSQDQTKHLTRIHSYYIVAKGIATSNKSIATSNKGITTSSKRSCERHFWAYEPVPHPPPLGVGGRPVAASRTRRSRRSSSCGTVRSRCPRRAWQRPTTAWTKTIPVFYRHQCVTDCCFVWKRPIVCE